MSIYVKALASGSSGNATLVRAGGTTVLIDAGLSGRALASLLRAQHVQPGDLAAILISHEHSDHIYGAAALSRLYKAPLLANRATLAAIDAPRAATGVLDTGETRRIGTITVQTLPIPHDAREPVGFTLEYEGWRMFMATDVGYDTPDLEPYIAAADLVVLEANHDVATLRASTKYSWPLKNRILGNGGHLSNDQSGRLLERAFARAPHRRRWLWLAHLSEENNTPQRAREQIALRLDLAGMLRDVELTVAERARPSAEWHSHKLSHQLALF